MKVEMLHCDNPGCRSIVEAEEPYGWIIDDLTFIGSGPTVHVEVCGHDCLSPGVEAALDRLHYEEMEQRRAQHAESEARVLAQACLRCRAIPGERCVASTGRPAQDFHASRREAARVLSRAEREDNPQ